MFVITLPARHRGVRRMVRRYEPKIGRLVRLQVVFQPARLLGPRGCLFSTVAREILQIAVHYAEVPVAPVERIIGHGGLKEIVEIVAITLMISQRRENYGLTQKLLLDIEEDRPLGIVVSVFDHIAALQ